MPKRIISILVLFALLFSLSFSQIASNLCSEWILADSNGRFIAGNNVNKVWPLASITKLMNAYVVLQNIQDGKFSLNQTTIVNRVSANTSGSSAQLPYGQKITISDLLKGMIIPSGNDAAMALSYCVGNGSPARFVNQMNQQAKKLGMNHTHYYTPDGLPTDMTGKPLDTSTVSDIAILASHLMASKTFMSICSLGETKICNGKIMLYSSNPILISVPGTTGMKTGHHNESKYNIVVSTNRHGEKYIIIVFGGKTVAQRDIVAKQIIHLAYSQVENTVLLKSGQVVKSFSVFDGASRLNVTVSQDVKANIIDGTENKITYHYNLIKNITAPIQKNDVVGAVSIYYQGEWIDTTNLIALNDVKKSADKSDIEKVI